MPKKKKDNLYFTKDHESAIIKYASSVDRYEKQKLYEIWIQPAFNEMVDKICFTYRFTSLPNSEYLRDDCKLWLVTILEKYDASKGYKAFSYFSVITKNWFIQQTKKKDKRARREIDIEDVHTEIEENNSTLMDSHSEETERAEFWSYLLQNINLWVEEENQINGQKESMNNDLRVLLAIKSILENPDDVEILNKKAIFLYLREITGLNTKQIALSLKKYRDKYSHFKYKWYNT